jgi:hypothetical protein
MFAVQIGISVPRYRPLGKPRYRTWAVPLCTATYDRYYYTVTKTMVQFTCVPGLISIETFFIVSQGFTGRRILRPYTHKF